MIHADGAPGVELFGRAARHPGVPRHRRIHDAEHDGVYAHAARGEFGGGGPEQSLDRAFGGGVGRVAAVALVRGERRDEHGRRAVRMVRALREPTEELEGEEGVDGEEAVRRLVLHEPERGGSDEPGGVDEAAYGVETLLDGGGHARGGVGRFEVHRRADGIGI